MRLQICVYATGRVTVGLRDRIAQRIAARLDAVAAAYVEQHEAKVAAEIELGADRSACREYRGKHGCCEHQTTTPHLTSFSQALRPPLIGATFTSRRVRSSAHRRWTIPPALGRRIRPDRTTRPTRASSDDGQGPCQHSCFVESDGYSRTHAGTPEKRRISASSSRYWDAAV